MRNQPFYIAVCDDTQSDREKASTIQQGVEDSALSKQHIDEIVDFVRSQQAAIENINEELKEVAEIVENNAASAQENNAISQQLNECAQSLMQMADSYIL